MHSLLAESFSFLQYKMKYIDYNLFPLPFIFFFFFTQNLEENIQKLFFFLSFFFLVSLTNIFIWKVTLSEGKRISFVVFLPKACFPLWKSSNNLKILDRDLTVSAQNINPSIPQSAAALWNNLMLLLGLSDDFVKHNIVFKVDQRHWVRKCCCVTNNQVQLLKSESAFSV